jgi:hypothetical protein
MKRKNISWKERLHEHSLFLVKYAFSRNMPFKKAFVPYQRSEKNIGKNF